MPDRDRTSTNGDSLTAIMETLVDETEGENVTIGELVEAIGGRGFGPLLVVIAFIAVAPTGAIPGMSILTGTLIVLISGQILLGRDHPWLPERLERFTFPRKRLKEAVDSAEPVTRRIDSWFGKRLTVLTDGRARYIVATVAIVMATLMYPLALVPFGVAAPGTAVLILGLALAVQDGVMIAVGLASSVGALGLGIHLLL